MSAYVVQPSLVFEKYLRGGDLALVNFINSIVKFLVIGLMLFVVLAILLVELGDPLLNIPTILFKAD